MIRITQESKFKPKNTLSLFLLKQIRRKRRLQTKQLSPVLFLLLSLLKRRVKLKIPSIGAQRYRQMCHSNLIESARLLTGILKIHRRRC